MASPSQNGTGIIAGINVTPLVDITLVLLIVFIVTAKMIVTPAVPLDLPRASQSEELQVVFSVILPASGATLVDGEPVPTDERLRSLAQDALARTPALRAVISADGAVPHRRVLATLDLIKSAGITRVAFAARPLDDQSPGEAH
jgi:biopolymer transport protein TolR